MFVTREHATHATRAVRSWQDGDHCRTAYHSSYDKATSDRTIGKLVTVSYLDVCSKYPRL